MPVTVDSRYELPRFRGATAATPNEPEVEALAGQELADEGAVEKAGPHGARAPRRAPAPGHAGQPRAWPSSSARAPVTFMPIHGTDEIADVTGAGDTVISTFTVALAAGAAPGEAAWLANVAGGVVVMKRGTATVTASELAAALASNGERSQR